MYDVILKNGVLTDAANGLREANMDVAVKDGVIAAIAPEFSGTTSFEALRAGFPPDIISGDLTRNTFGHLPAVSLPYLMTRFLAMGMPFADVLACVTTKPAEVLGMENEIGELKVGANADIAVFERRQGSFSFILFSNKTLQFASAYFPPCVVVVLDVRQHACVLRLA